MKINSIFNHPINSKNNLQPNKTAPISQKPSSYNIEYAKLPLTSDYLAFLGGFSLDLGQTYKNLNENQYPPEIKEKVKEALKNNEENKTLFDVHFDKYKGVLECYSLNELKQKYPEFSDVKSAYEVFAKPDSFIGQFQNDELELFSSDEDLTLQLIKLYWGKGLSLNDLSNYIKENSSDDKGKNLYYSMSKKLNIPLMNSRYASILKLSDKGYNERFTKTLSEKLRETGQRRIQKEEGEPVFIPQGTLSEEHKQHISEGLKKYYENNPDAVYNLSKRQKQYYEDNPDAKERFCEVLDYAWNRTSEGKTIKKKLSKFFEKRGQRLSDKELVLKKDMNKEQQNFLKDFWRMNSWAKKHWSTAMKKGWEYHSESAGEFLYGEDIAGKKISFSLFPSAVLDDIENYAKKVNFDYRKYNIRKSYIHNMEEAKEKKVIEYIKRANDFVTGFLSKQDDKYLDNVADSRLCAVIEFKDALENNSKTLPKSLQENDMDRYNLNFRLEKAFIDAPVYTCTPTGKKIPLNGVDNGQLNAIIGVIMSTACEQGNLDVPEYFLELMDKYYKIDVKAKMQELGLSLDDFAHLL